MENVTAAGSPSPAPGSEKQFHRFVTVSLGPASVDLEITWSAGTASVADVIAAARDIAAIRDNGPDVSTVMIDGRIVATTTAAERGGIATGSVIDCAHSSMGSPAEQPIAGRGDRGTETFSSLRIDHIGGRDAGARFEIADGAVIELHHRQGATLVGQVGAGGFARDDEQRWVVGDYVEAGPEVLAVEARALRPDETRTANRSDDGSGEPLAVHRPPRVVPPSRAEVPRRPEVPARPPDAPPLSWASLLAPIPIGIAMALLFRPYFLLFTAAGPVMFIGRWWEGRRRHRRACIQWQREIYDRNAEYQRQLEAMAKRAALERRRSHPTICEIVDRVERCDRSLWERRPVHDDFAVVAVAYGDTSWSQPGSASSLLGGDQPSRPVNLTMVPLLVDLRRHRLVAIVGTDAAQSLCRALVCQLSVLHGPAHLRVGHGPTKTQTWEWMKWLPHYVSCDDDLGAAADPTMEPAVKSAMEKPSAETLGTIRVVDVGADHPSSSAIVVARSPDDVPTNCSLLIDCRHYETGEPGAAIEITEVETGTSARANNLIGVSQARAETVARRLARLVDPEMATSSGAIPKAIPLADLEGWHREDPIIDSWEQDGFTHLSAALGVAGCRYEIDLVADGPHALVAGTTGSGKSELLRTWVTALAGRHSPQACAFVLIDFKGGGAFDAVASLPHVVAVVTDLDEGLAQRGLRSLRAELRDREHRFREKGVADIEAYYRLGLRDLPRLVVIIDEFATLAAELPTFLDGLVDIAQRGRSLGVHMVLATQRPAGVLDQKIRANTNLRICLRVQDSADSIDVIDVSDAANLPRNRPGRALVRSGADELQLIQCAHIGPSEVGLNQPMRYRRFDAHESRPWRPVAQALPGAVERVRAAAARCADEPFVVPANAPWCAPLPDSLDRADLWHQNPPHGLAIPIGVEDRPDERLQKVWYWDRSAGPLLVVGGTDGERRAVIASVIDGVGRSDPSTDTYVIHTEIGATPFDVAGWPGAIDADDVERIDRVLLRCANTGPKSEPLVVIIERFDLLGTAATELDAAILREHLERVVAQSSRSVSFVICGATERSIPSRVTAYAAQRLVLRLADASAYAAVGLRERTMPAITPMGAVDPRESTAVRLAGADGEDYAGLHFPSSHSVRSAPKVLRSSELASEAHSVGSLLCGELSLSVGLDLVTQRPFVARITPDEPFIVAGERRSGRTAALAAFVDCVGRLLAHSDTDAPGTVVDADAPDTVVDGDVGGIVVDADAPDIVIVAGVARNAAIYEQWDHAISVWSNDSLESEDSVAHRIGELDAPHIIIVDDGDRIDDDDGRALVDAARAGGHYLVVASTSEAVRSLRSWPSALRSARNGIVLGFDRGDGDILRTGSLRFCGIDWQPGRGIAMSQSEPALVQLAWTAALGDSP